MEQSRQIITDAKFIKEKSCPEHCGSSSCALREAGLSCKLRATRIG